MANMFRKFSLIEMHGNYTAQIWSGKPRQQQQHCIIVCKDCRFFIHLLFTRILCEKTNDNLDRKYMEESKRSCCFSSKLADLEKPELDKVYDIAGYLLGRLNKYFTRKKIGMSDDFLFCHLFCHKYLSVHVLIERMKIQTKQRMKKGRKITCL